MMINKCVLPKLLACFALVNLFSPVAAEAAANETTYAILKPAAERGDIPAQFSLGYLYEHGAGIQQDIPQAIYWYTQAAKNDHIDAQYRLSSLYVSKKNAVRNPSKALRWLEKAAKQGHLEAQYQLGKRYLSGNSIEKNQSLGYRWLESAKEGGHIEAENLLTSSRLQQRIEKNSLVIKSRRANIRQGPGKQHNVIIMIRRGDKVQLLTDGRRWAQVQVDKTGDIGWVARHLITKPK